MILQYVGMTLLVLAFYNLSAHCKNFRRVACVQNVFGTNFHGSLSYKVKLYFISFMLDVGD